MISQQPEVHNTFASGDSCFCAAKVAPVALSTITASVNWLSDKRCWYVSINHQIGPLSRTEQKSLWPQAVYREPLTYRIIFTTLRRDRLFYKSEFCPQIPSEDLSTEGKSIVHRGRIIMTHTLDYLLPEDCVWELSYAARISSGRPSGMDAFAVSSLPSFMALE